MAGRPTVDCYGSDAFQVHHCAIIRGRVVATCTVALRRDTHHPFAFCVWASREAATLGHEPLAVLGVAKLGEAKKALQFYAANPLRLEELLPPGLPAVDERAA